MPSIWAGGCWWAVVGVEPTDGFQRLACLPKAKNQKFSADSYRSGAQNSVTTKPFTVSTGHTTTERNSTDRKTKSFSEKKTTESNFSIGLSSNGYKEGEMRRKYRVQGARRQKC
ncbi:Protein CBG12205 [Caenorhabditis briggsae]|uniref:Protein CBG12205 n=1 Tax=Caenorhabditis briggsae TaxID=6238 RepID=A8XF01_CAEBR|nr:Protein CBG12205 [Caenorhabditis briggsae]CAP31223.1 Protein CBG12205 [Caenorhabditis briggsae]